MIAGANSALLDVPLRGERDYVHSTDLHAALGGLGRARLSPTAWVRALVLRRAAFCQPEAHFLPRDDAFATFTLCDGGTSIPGWLAETPQPITRRIMFDEAPVRAAALLRPRHAALTAPVPGYTAFEQMVVLLKLLCGRIRPGHWLFTALDLHQPLRENAPQELRLQQVMLGRGMSAGLHQGGEDIGRAQMALAQEARHEPRIA